MQPVVHYTPSPANYPVLPLDEAPPSYFQSISTDQKIALLADAIIAQLTELKNVTLLIESNTSGFNKKHQKALKSLYKLHNNADTLYSKTPALELLENIRRLGQSSATYNLRENPEMNFTGFFEKLNNHVEAMVVYSHIIKLKPLA